MFKNKKNIFILAALFLILFSAYYNQNVQQKADLNSENNLSLLETDSIGEKSKVEENESQMVVHLAGAVKNAGVYKLNKNDRLVDLISAAGGLKEDADLEQINLAERLFDGQKIIIPISKENYSQINNDSNLMFKNNEEILVNNYSGSAKSELININQADQSQLENLSGIGPSKAASIIKYRKEKGYFSKKEDLLNISGIGEKTLANIEDEIDLQ